MITITWHLILYMLIEIVGFIWAICSDDTEHGYVGLSTRDCRIMLWIILSIIFTTIYGGIFWW